MLLEKATETSLLVDAKGVKLEIPYEQIKRANLETDISKVKETKVESESQAELEVEIDEDVE